MKVNRLFFTVLILALTLAAAVGCASGGKPNGKNTETTAQTPDNSSDAITTQTQPAQTDPAQTTGEEENPLVPSADIISYPLNSNTKGVRILGKRYLASETQINCDWSCSGLEVNIHTVGGNMTFIARVSAPAEGACYFRAYVDGTPWLNADGTPYYTVTTERTPLVLREIPAGDHTVRLVKVTGYTLARAEISHVLFAGTISETAPAEKPLYLEFIGDSICCGWGTIGNFQGAYTDQDGTLAYPYLTAAELNADYAVTALSGQGLLLGNPGTYQGYLYASTLRSTESPYEPTRQADFTIVNIGTNDKYNEKPAEQVRQALEQLLRRILEKNPNGKVVFIYNTMNDNYSAEILDLCEKAGGEAAGIYALRFDRAEKEGHPTNHPSVSEQRKEADRLIAFLQEKMDTPITAVPFGEDPSSNGLANGGNGDENALLTIFYKDLTFQ